MALTVQNYLDYLDKEMTIMGVLSAFCALVPALTLDRVGSASASGALFYQLWHCERGYIFVGSVSFIIAAGTFYRQRSWLAWFYGQITLSTLEIYPDGWDTKQWLQEADSWATWVPYRAAFWLTGLGFYEYGAALVGFRYWGYAVLVWLPFVLIAVIQAPCLMILSSEKYKFADEPLKQFLKSYFAK